MASTTTGSHYTCRIHATNNIRRNISPRSPNHQPQMHPPRHHPQKRKRHCQTNLSLWAAAAGPLTKTILPPIKRTRTPDTSRHLANMCPHPRCDLAALQGLTRGPTKSPATPCQACQKFDHVIKLATALEKALQKTPSARTTIAHIPRVVSRLGGPWTSR